MNIVIILTCFALVLILSRLRLPLSACLLIGALFSAPLVENVIGEDKISAERKAMINHWFRHLWEYWWPLYPGFVLAVELLGADHSGGGGYPPPQSVRSFLRPGES